MQADPSHSPSAQVEAGSVVGLWRYPVKSMMGEEVNAAEVTERSLVGDRRFAVVDAETGKVAGAKNPRKWGSFFDFRAAYVEPPQGKSKLPAVPSSRISPAFTVEITALASRGTCTSMSYVTR